MNETVWDTAEGLLKQLPTDVEELALLLMAKSVLGVRDRAHCCPIARWLRTELAIPYVEVDANDIELFDENGNRCRLEAPLSVGVFINAFDLDDAWPGLVDPDGETAEEKWGYDHHSNRFYRNYLV